MFAAYDDNDVYRKDLSGSNLSYYRAIVEETFGRACKVFKDTAQVKFRPQKGSELAGWRIATLLPAALAQGEPLNSIATVENKYKYRWLDDGSPTIKPTAEDNLKPMFARLDVCSLRAANEQTLLDCFTSRPELSVNSQLEAERRPATGTNLALAPIRTLLCLSKSNELYLTGTLALFFDVNEKSNSFKWAWQGREFVKRLVWQPEQATKRLRDFADPATADYFETKDICKEDGELCDEAGKIARTLSRRELLALYDECKKFDQKSPPNLQRLLTDRTWGVKEMERVLMALNSAERLTVRSAATECVRTLPAGFRCFYFSNNSYLDAFISDISLASQRRGGSDYSMRADLPDEMKYEWRTPNNLQPEDAKWVQLILPILKLDPRPPNAPGTAPRTQSLAPMGFHATNTPYTDGKRIFLYYKDMKVIDREKKRNLPADPDKPDEHLRDKEKGKESLPLLRKWKKGKAFQGENWGHSVTPREQAGLVMARALREFDFYVDAMAVDEKITRSQLPAKNFARFIRTLKPESVDTKETDQEWCHLLGHGDGGTETLDNFVCGTDHCNTEQLAIETGQRRVTQNPNIDPKVRKRFTWKITAHLLGDHRARTTIANAWDEISDQLKRLGVTKKVRQELKRVALDPEKDLLGALKKRISGLQNELKKQSSQANHDVKRLGELVQFLNLYEKTWEIVLPLARCIHYRISYNGSRCFEHYFDAQSQSFDVNEARILDYTVERALYRELEKDQRVQITLPDGTTLKPMAYYWKLIEERVGGNYPRGMKRVRDKAEPATPQAEPPPSTPGRVLRALRQKPTATDDDMVIDD